MTYHVRLIGADQLPPEHSWAMVRHRGDCFCFVKPEGLTTDTLEAAWTAYRMLQRQPVG